MEPSKISSNLVRRIVASVAREERTALRIYKDIASSRASIDCLSSKINSHLGRISRWREEHRVLTKSIARKKAIIMRSVVAHRQTDTNAEISSQESGTKPLPKDVVDLTCSESQTQEHTHFLDTLCSATALPPRDPENEVPFDVTGIMDFLELENLEWPTNDCRTPLSRTPSQSGGQDTCWSPQL